MTMLGPMILLVGLALPAGAEPESIDDLVEAATRRVVKVYGAGGIGRIEAYGTGILVSPSGHILAASGPMLETEGLKVVLADGTSVAARPVAVDADLGLALLKVEIEDAPYFDMTSPIEPRAGDSVYAFSNAFNIAAGAEPVSVMRGVIAAVAPLGAARDSCLIVDAVTSNPGSAGGALVDARRRLVGMLAREQRDPATNTWVHAAIPAARLAAFLAAAREGRVAKPATPAPGQSVPASLRGLCFMVDALDRMPAYIEAVEWDSPADQAGIRPDDLVLFVEDRLVHTLAECRDAIGKLPAGGSWRIGVLRNERLLHFEIPAGGTKPVSQGKSP